MKKTIQFEPMRDRLGIPRATMERIVKEQRDGFPAPIYIGRRRYFDLEAVEAWQASRRTAPQSIPANDNGERAVA